LAPVARGDAEPLLPNGNGLTRDEVSRIVNDLDTQEQIDAFLTTVVLTEAEPDTQATVEALLTAVDTEEDGIVLLVGATVVGALTIALFLDGRYQTLTVDVPPGWSDLGLDERRERAENAMAGAPRTEVDFDALASYRDLVDEHFRTVTRGHGATLVSGDADLNEYHSRMVDTLMMAHAVQGRLGFGPWLQDAEDELLESLNDQLDYLQEMVAQMEAGTVTPAQAEERSGRYGANGGITFNRGLAYVAFIVGTAYEQRFLGNCSPHCQDCVDYAAQGRQPIGTLPKPREQCRCGPNCCCRLEFFTLDGAQWGWIG
jgi:hypothetical protein